MAAIAMTVTYGGRDWIRSAPPGWASAQVICFAVGTGTTAPTVNDTQLAAEAYRNVFQNAANGTNHGEIHMYGFIDLAFANVTISELGLFASITGNTASATTANTGVLIARALWSPALSKTNQNTVTLDFDILF